MRVLAVSLALLLGSVWGARAAGVFTEDERSKIAAFWNTPGRYQILPPEGVEKKGLWQVRLTPEGSLWFWKYQNAIGASKAPPTQSPTEQNTAPRWRLLFGDVENMGRRKTCF